MVDCKQYTDNEVIHLAMGESTYFVCLYDKYQSQFIRYILRLSSMNAVDAEDVLQDAFVKIWRNINSFDQNMKFSTWAYRIVHNETVSSWRKQKGMHLDSLSVFDESHSIEPTDGADVLQKEGAIQMVLKKMSPDYRSILVLRYLEQLDYEEISDVLKIPMGTVATRLSRAKKLFAKISTDKNIIFFEE